MKHYDEFDDYYEYDNRIEPAYIVTSNFSERVLADVLMNAGLVVDKSPKYVCNMRKLVFVHGEDSEVYSREEIKFIEQIKQVFVYQDFSKKMTSGHMICRVICTKFDCNSREALFRCLFFEKIINKALDGFNIFFFVTQDSAFFGCRLFDKENNHNCTLSKPIKEEIEFRHMLEQLADLTRVDSFIEYYENFQGIIKFDDITDEYYEEKLMQHRGLDRYISYNNSINKIAAEIGIDPSTIKRNWTNEHSNYKEVPFRVLLEEAEESLAFVKSNRVNTYELLFEANEMEQRAEEIEIENSNITQALEDGAEKLDSVSNEKLRSLLNNLEETIRFIKGQNDT